MAYAHAMITSVIILLLLSLLVATESAPSTSVPRRGK